MLLLCLFSTMIFQSCRTDNTIYEQEKGEQSYFSIFNNPNSNTSRKGNHYQEAFRTLYYSYLDAHPENAPDFSNKNILQVDFRFASQEIIDDDGKVYVLFPVVLNENVVEVVMASVNKELSEVGFHVLVKNDDVKSVIDTFSKKMKKDKTGTYSGPDSNIEEVLIIVPPKEKEPAALVEIELPPTGNCEIFNICGGSGGDFSLNPPDSNPCVKINELLTDYDFSLKLANLDKPDVFGLNHEMGHAAFFQNGSTHYTSMSNYSGTTKLIPPSGSLFFGFIHTHQNFDSDGNPTIKMFSPADLDTFLSLCATMHIIRVKLAEAYAMVVTSQGNYIIKYNGTASWTNPGPGTMEWWNKWYKDEMRAIQNADKSFDQDKVEKAFLKFLKERVGIDGIELYSVDKNSGDTKKLSLDANNNLNTPIPCQ
ncbi:hypothetical protein [Frigoriflavimonas asaccharolytica]|uniref:Uncharacterized protein n=1 Tax=Frigoriflavimonas asaccharolytica TaxID=2735899 RepID=A0A8J8G8X8_9FLAO|nr:hypothetical protein [Frigoriflavimonas asaccharolytica]NRS91664.1 hypothetical protein [Frigoriflavimonas asaccharolytica]